MRTSFKPCVIICLLAGGTLGGCVSDEYLALYSPPGLPAPAAILMDAPAPIPSKMPWQLTPASTSSIAQGEMTIIVPNARFGRVKGTSIAVANLEKPVVAYAPRGRTVLACKQNVEPQAKSIGAYSVQAAAAGPERRNADGSRTQQVFFRIIYDRPAYLEVRQAALICTTNAEGKIVDLHPM